MVFVFSINSVLNIPSIFVELNLGMTVSKYKNPINEKHVLLRLDMATRRRNIHFKKIVIYAQLPFLCVYSDKLAAKLCVYNSVGIARYLTLLLKQFHMLTKGCKVLPKHSCATELCI